MKVSTVLVLILFCTACASTSRKPAAVDTYGPTDSILLMSDLHFDPLYDPSIVPALIQNTDGSQWTALFESSKIAAFSTYGADTNYPILKSSLEAMKKTDPHPRAVIITGDFLRHKFEQRFKTLAPDAAKQFRPFADATSRFLAQIVQSYFPDTLIIPVIGNNDDACGDYVIQPHGSSLQAFANAWALAANHNQSSPDFIAGAEAAGHFTELMPAVANGKALRLIVANGVYWSPRYQNSCGDAAATPGADELAWLEHQLDASQKNGEKVWLVNHIPAGVDFAMTVFKEPHYCTAKKFTMMLKSDFNEKYLDLIRRFSSTIAASINGHTHNNEFRVYGEKREAVLAINTPSLAPNHENNPGFQILTIDPTTLAIHNAATYTLDLSSSGSKAPPTWEKSYDFDQFFQQTEISATSFTNVLQALATYKPDARADYSRFMNSGAKPSEFLISNWDMYVCAMTHATAESVETCACPK